jgi:hypothetical protein
LSRVKSQPDFPFSEIEMFVAGSLITVAWLGVLFAEVSRAGSERKYAAKRQQEIEAQIVACRVGKPGYTYDGVLVPDVQKVTLRKSSDFNKLCHDPSITR